MEDILIAFFGHGNLLEIISGFFWAVMCALFVNLPDLNKMSFKDYIKILLSIIITLRLDPIVCLWINMDLNLGNTAAVSSVTGAIAGLVGVKFIDKITKFLKDKLK
jgi:hypothetical protein